MFTMIITEYGEADKDFGNNSLSMRVYSQPKIQPDVVLQKNKILINILPRWLFQKDVLVIALRKIFWIFTTGSYGPQIDKLNIPVILRLCIVFFAPCCFRGFACRFLCIQNHLEGQ